MITITNRRVFVNTAIITRVHVRRLRVNAVARNIPRRGYVRIVNGMSAPFAVCKIVAYMVIRILAHVPVVQQHRLRTPIVPFVTMIRARSANSLIALSIRHMIVLRLNIVVVVTPNWMRSPARVRRDVLSENVPFASIRFAFCITK